MGEREIIGFNEKGSNRSEFIKRLKLKKKKKKRHKKVIKTGLENEGRG